MEDIVIEDKRRFLRCAGCGQWRPWRGSLIFTHADVQFELPICSEACGERVRPYDPDWQPIPERVAPLLAAFEAAAG